MSTSRTSSTLKNHIQELKSRAAYTLFSVVLTFSFAYLNATQLVYVFLLSFSLGEPEEKSFIFTDVFEAFSSTVSICLVMSLLCALPLGMYQLISFLAPSWYLFERRKYCKRVIKIFSLWACYVYMIHSFLIPRLCSFLLQFQIKNDCLLLAIEPKILSYVLWATSLLGVATVVFFLMCAFYLYILSKEWDMREWGKRRKVSFLVSLLLASFLSPPELWSQLLLALFLFATLELLLWNCFIQNSLYLKRKVSFRLRLGSPYGAGEANTAKLCLRCTAES